MDNKEDSSLVSLATKAEEDNPQTGQSAANTPQPKLFDSSLFDQPSKDGGAADDFMADIAGKGESAAESAPENVSGNDTGILPGNFLDLEVRDEGSNEGSDITLDSIPVEGPTQEPPEVNQGQTELGGETPQKNYGESLIQIQDDTEDKKPAEGGDVMIGDSAGVKTVEDDPLGPLSEQAEPTQAAETKQEKVGDDEILNRVEDERSPFEEGKPVQVAEPKQEEVKDSENINTAGVEKPSTIEQGRPTQLAIPKQDKESKVQSNESGKSSESPLHGILKQPSSGTHQIKRISWGDDDPFLSAITNSETDRRQDAWLPCEATAKVLQSRAAMQGTDYSSRPDLTMPGISFDEAQMDPLKELLYKYQGEEEAKKRNKLTLDQVSRDLDGLKRLLNDGCLRSAVQLTGLLLTSVGQGKGQAGMPSQNTAESLQIWFTRLALLVKLRQFSTADIESQPFKDLDKPDMYYQYYPALYPGRKGSMAPFSFRVLLAELPQYVSQHQESMTRLYALLITSQKIVSNLSNGCDEYGSKSGVTEENIKASLALWKSRVHRIQHSIGNCLLAMKDYYQSIKVFETLSKTDPENRTKVQSLIGRIYLQLGDLKSAQEVFGIVEKDTKPGDTNGSIQVLMNRGFLRMAQNMYTDAHIQFSEVLKLEPAHFTAINNISVCLLYMGKLKSALTLLEQLINGDPEKYLDESILFNLCTLYELESSRSAAKKQSLLCTAAKHRGDGFNVSCLKLT